MRCVRVPEAPSPSLPAPNPILVFLPALSQISKVPRATTHMQQMSKADGTRLPSGEPSALLSPYDKKNIYPRGYHIKLSISEYRLRHKCAESGEWATGEEEGSRSSASLSPQRPDAAANAAEDLEQRLHRDLAAHQPKGVFDAQPTASERQRENLSSRLRREFGLALPEDENHEHDPLKRCDR